MKRLIVMLVVLVMASSAFALDGWYHDLTVDNLIVRETVEGVFGNWELTDTGCLTIDSVIVDGTLTSVTYNFADATAVGGTVDDITMDFTPNFPTITAGMMITFISEGLNTGATTLDIDGVGAVNVFEASDVSACEGGEIVAGMAVVLMYDGTQWQILNQP